MRVRSLASFATDRRLVSPIVAAIDSNGINSSLRVLWKSFPEHPAFVFIYSTVLFNFSTVVGLPFSFSLSFHLASRTLRLLKFVQSVIIRSATYKPPDQPKTFEPSKFFNLVSFLPQVHLNYSPPIERLNQHNDHKRSRFEAERAKQSDRRAWRPVG